MRSVGLLHSQSSSASSVKAFQSESQNHPSVHLTGPAWKQFISEQSPTYMDERHRECLQHHYVEFVQNFQDASQILWYLREDGILSSEQEQIVLSKASFQEGNRQLHSYLLKKGNMGFFSLFHAYEQGKNNMYHISLSYSMRNWPFIVVKMSFLTSWQMCKNPYLQVAFIERLNKKI